MPGNPLSTFTVNEEQAGRPYDEQAPSGERWGAVSVTAAPKSVLDASVPSNTLVGNYGYLTYTNSLAAERMPNVEIPGMQGERGFEITFSGTSNPFGNNQGTDIDYRYNVPLSQTYFYLKMVQPSNLRWRRIATADIADINDVSAWDVGDELEAQGVVIGTYAGAGDDNGDLAIGIDNYTGGSPETRMSNGTIITNTTKGLTVTSLKGSSKNQVAKLLTDWVGLGGAGDEYPYGGMHMGVDCVSIRDQDISGNAVPYFNASLSDSGSGDAKGNISNQLAGEAIMFDVGDNGEVVEYVVHRKRASGDGVNDGVFGLWKRVNVAGHPLENWTYVFENSSQSIWSPHEDNKWTYGYLFGNKNGSYDVDTTYYLMRVEMWTEKPTFLTEAGV